MTSLSIELGAAYLAIVPETSKIAPGVTDSLKALQPSVTPKVDGAGAGQSFLTGFMPSVKKLAAAAAGIFAVKEIVSFGKESVAAFTDTTKAAVGLQRVIGGTIEDSSRLNFAASQSGVSQDKLSNSLKLLERNVVSVGGATPAGAKALEAMGLSATDASGNIRPMGELLPDIAAKFKEMPNGAEKSALALKLFGRSGLDMLPMLNRGKDGLTELMKKSDEFGLTVGNKQAEALKKSVVAQREWDASLQGLKVQIGANLLPLMTELSVFFREKLIPGIVAASGYVREHGSEIASVAKVVIPVIASLSLMIATASGIRKVKGAFDTFAAGLTGAKAAATGLKGGLSSLFASGGKFSSLAAGAKTAATSMATFGKAAALAAVDAVKAAAVWVASMVRMGAIAVVEALKASAAWVASTARTAAALVAQGAAFVASRAVMLASAAVTGVVTAAQWLLNAALTANPIGLIVVAIAAFVAALVLAYNNSETFRNIVNAAWSTIKTVVGAVVDWLRVTVPAVFEWIKNAFLTYTPLGLVISHWGSIQAFISGAVGVIRGVISWFAGLPGMFADWFTGAKNAAMGKLNELVGFVSGIPSSILGAIGDLGGLLWSKGSELIGGLIEGIRSRLAGIREIMSQVAATIGGFLPGSPVKEGPLTSWNNGGAGKRLVADGIVAGLLASGDDVSAALSSVLTVPSAQFSGIGVSLSRTEASVAPATTMNSAAFPSTLAVVDSDGALIGRMRVEAAGVVDDRTTAAASGARRTVL